MKTTTTEHLPMIPINIVRELRTPKRPGPFLRMVWSACALAVVIALRVTDAAIFVEEWLKV